MILFVKRRYFVTCKHLSATYMPWSVATIFIAPRSAGKEAKLLTASQTYQLPPVLRKVVTLTTWAELREESCNLFQVVHTHMSAPNRALRALFPSIRDN